MSSAVAIGHTIDFGVPSLKALFAKTGGKLPEGEKPSVTVWPASYFVQAMAIADKFVI